MLWKVSLPVTGKNKAKVSSLRQTACQRNMNRGLMRNAMRLMPVHQLSALSIEVRQFSTSVSSFLS